MRHYGPAKVLDAKKVSGLAGAGPLVADWTDYFGIKTESIT